ncbi:MAG TPA: energy transducer TonB [Candidatus Angelobacter sp.]|nr:energy transducer TonB [Candidatus Angelobacter sp.]
MSTPRSSKGLLGALSLSLMLFWAATGHAQETTRKVLKKVTAQYPAILKSKGIGGTVRLRVIIKPDGSVKDTELIGGNPILAESAQKALLQWKFAPASSETTMEISVVFDPHSEN